MKLRRQINNLSEVIARNNAATAKGTAAERAKTTEINRGIRAQQQLLRAQQQRQSIALAGLRQETGLLAQSRRQTSLLSRATGGLGAQLASLGFSTVAAEVGEFVRQSIRASVQLDSQTRALAVLTGSLREAEAAMRDVQELADLPGLRFEAAIRGTVALRAIGVEAKTTTRILTELGNAAAFSGGEGEFERGLLGFRQLIQRGRISQEELNQLTENIGLASRVLKEEFGSVLAEDIQASLDLAGQTVEDFVERTLAGFEKLERFPLDAPSVKLKNLSNSFFEFQAAVGDQFLPLIASGAETLTNFFDVLAEGLRSTENLKALANAMELVTDAVFEASTAFSDRASIISYVESLREIRDAQQGIIDQDNWWQYTDDAVEGVAELTQWINLYENALAGVPTASAELRTELVATNAQYAEQRAARVEILSQLKAERESIFGNVGLYKDQLDANEEAITQNRAKAQVLENIVKALDDTTEAETEATESARLAGIVQKVLQESYTQSADAAGQLASELKLLRETVTENESAQEKLNEFWQAASGQLETYSGSVDLATVSLAQFRNENELLFDGDLADPLQAEIDQFGTLERAIENVSEASLSFIADQAIANAEIRLVNPAISDAVESMRDYNAVMGDVQTEFQSVETLSDMVTASVREQASAFDDLRRAVSGVSQSQRGLQGQELGSGALDSFDPSSPTYTRNQGFFDPRISGGTFGDSVRELGVNLGNFTEGFTLDINSIVRAMEGTAEPFDVFESAIVSINPALSIFTTGLRLLGQEFEEAERGRRRREEFIRLGGDVGPRESFNRSRLGGGISGTDLPDPTGLIIEAFGGFYENILQDLQENLRQAEFNLDFSQQTLTRR